MASSLIEDLSRLRLRIVGDPWHVDVAGRHAVGSCLHSLSSIGLELLEVNLQWALLEIQAVWLLVSTRRCRAMVILLRSLLFGLLGRGVALEILVLRLRGMLLLWLLVLMLLLLRLLLLLLRLRRRRLRR